MKRLGTLGERIDRLFVELNRLNEVKSFKIVVLSGVNRFLLEHCEPHMCVTDVAEKAEQVQTQVSKVGQRLMEVLKRRKK